MQPTSGTLTDTEIQLIKDTWGHIIVHKAKAGQLFYSKLFQMAPALRPLFKGDTEGQAKKFVDMVTVIVTKLNKIDDVYNEVDFLARKHVKYGAQPAHYVPVGKAFLEAMAESLGNKWTEDVAKAWAKVYDIISGAMMKAQAKYTTA